ncbi:MAG TPA: tetratricopeptide repeat protein [Candidatus Bathyarchaeia archaeon]|nr:tetratricopeptide repeat protein [Candidatus Bathyarchaeia archaeon]
MRTITLRMLVPALAAVVCLALAAPRCARARLSGQEISNHLAQGEQQFHRAMELDRTDPEAAKAYYQEAILHYEAIVKDAHIRNGKLYYDIGNAYFRLGDVGRAILNYKRAELFIQNDPNLEQNLGFARDRRADRIEVRQREKVLKTLFFIHYDIPSRVKLVIFAISFAALWVSAGARLFFGTGWLKLALIVASVVSAVFLASLVVDSVSFAKSPEGVVTAQEIVGRMGDADTYQPSFKEPLHSGAEFRLLEKRPGWWHVELESGDRTWVPDGSAELLF